MMELEECEWMLCDAHGYPRMTLFGLKPSEGDHCRGKTCRCQPHGHGVLVSDLLNGEDPECPFDPDEWWNTPAYR